MASSGLLAPEMNDSENSESFRDAFTAIVGFFLIFTANAFAQESAPPGPAEVERVIVTGSNIPTAEETGPNPVDTYRPADLEKLGIRNSQDLQTFLPQEAGGTVNLNIAYSLGNLVFDGAPTVASWNRGALLEVGLNEDAKISSVSLIPIALEDGLPQLNVFQDNRLGSR